METLEQVFFWQVEIILKTLVILLGYDKICLSFIKEQEKNKKRGGVPPFFDFEK